MIHINTQLLKFQCEWYWLSVAVLLLSFGSWIGVAYIASGSTEIDYNFYFVSHSSISPFVCSCFAGITLVV